MASRQIEMYARTEAQRKPNLSERVTDLKSSAGVPAGILRPRIKPKFKIQSGATHTATTKGLRRP
jgi:hypothetical protein